MKFKQILVVSLACLVVIEAGGGYEKKNEGSAILAACKFGLLKYGKFCEKGNPKTFKCDCENQMSMGTLLSCAYENAIGNTKLKGQIIDNLYKSCGGNLSKEEIHESYNKVKDQLIDVSSISGKNRSKIMSVPFHYNKKEYNVALKSFKVRHRNYDDGISFGIMLMCFWGILLLLGTIKNFMEKFMPRVCLMAKKKIFGSYAVRKYRQFISLPALGGHKHATMMKFLGFAPTRFEFIVVSMFVFLSVLSHIIRLEFVQPNVYFKNGLVEMTRYVGDRSGILANFLSILVWLFAGRSNIFLFLTGWKQSTFLIYHRWISRILVVSVLVHTLSMFINALSISKKRYNKLAATLWWRMGAVATIACVTMLFQAHSYLRAHSYEIFLYLHIIIAVLFLVGSWIHTKIFEYEVWFFVCLLIWLLEKVLRIFLIARFGLQTAKARVVSYDTIELVVPCRRLSKFKPGLFCYIYFVNTSLFFQSHPFTAITGDDGSTIKFYIKKKNGITNKIYNKLLANPNKTPDIKVALEGFYGNTFPLHTYDNVILYGSGHGIPSLFSYAEKIGNLHKGSKSCFVKVHWIVRDYSFIDWFSAELKRLSHFDNVKVIVYITRPEQFLGSPLVKNQSDFINEDFSSDSIDNSVKKILNPLSHVEFRNFRPKLRDLVKTDLDEVLGSSVAILTCGHSLVVDSIRKAVAYEVGQRSKSVIDFFEDSQTW